MAPKRDGDPLVKTESKRPFIKAEHHDDVKFNLSSIPTAHTAVVKREPTGRKVTGPGGLVFHYPPNPQQQSHAAKPSKKHYARGPACVKVKLDYGQYITAHYDRSKSVVLLKETHSNGSPIAIEDPIRFTITERLKRCGIYVQPCKNPAVFNFFQPDKHGFVWSFDVVPDTQPVSKRDWTTKPESSTSDVKHEYSEKKEVPPNQ